MENRKKLKEMGLLNVEKLSSPENEKKGKGKKIKEDEADYECDTCRANLSVSLVSNPVDGSIFCLTHAIEYIEKKKQVLKNCTLLYMYNEVSRIVFLSIHTFLLCNFLFNFFLLFFCFIRIIFLYKFSIF